MKNQQNMQKNDFIEIEFAGKIKNGEIFDSNIKEELEKIPNSNKELAKPIIFALGQGMFLKGIEDFLIEKEPGKYEIELAPEKAFGTRMPKLVQVIPMNIFSKQEQKPFPGMLFNFDGRLGKILSVSGGRVTVDFNHPLAGKKVIYNINILRKIEDLNEKIKSFIDFLFRKPLNFKVEDKKIIIQLEDKEKQMKPFIELFSEKFKDVFNMELEVNGLIETKEPKKEDIKNP